jgi:hypothetical protein
MPRKLIIIAEVEIEVWDDSLDEHRASQGAENAVRTAIEMGKSATPGFMFNVKTVYDDTEDPDEPKQGAGGLGKSEPDGGDSQAVKTGQPQRTGTNTLAASPDSDTGQTKSGDVARPGEGDKVESVSGEVAPRTGEPGGPASPEQQREQTQAVREDAARHTLLTPRAATAPAVVTEAALRPSAVSEADTAPALAQPAASEGTTAATDSSPAASEPAPTPDAPTKVND